MSFALESAYRDQIRFSYTTFDRIVVRGHDQALQVPKGVAWWGRQLWPDGPITDARLGSLAKRFHAGVKRFAAERGIPVVQAHRGLDKLATATQHRAKWTGTTGVYLIIRAQETATTYRSFEPRESRDPNYRTLVKRIGRVDQYYFYLVDPTWGPISVRISSHVPFNVTVYLNGNRWLAREAARAGLTVTTADNSVVRCNDPAALRSLADTLGPQQLQAVCDRWAYRLLPVLTQAERQRTRFHYQWFLHQVELSHNMVFRRPQTLTRTLQRHVDLNRQALHPRSLKTIFGASPTGPYKRDCAVSVTHAFGGLTVLSAQYGETRVKQYNNHQQTFRTEACVNNLHDLGVKKALANLGTVRQRLQDLIEQFQAAQAVVLHTPCHRGELTALAKPGQVNATATPGIKLENERLLAVLTALPRFAHQADGFRAAEVRAVVGPELPSPYTGPQANYDLRKLRGKRLLERVAASHRYRLTAEGLRVAVLLGKLRDQLLEPALGSIRRQRRPPRPRRGLAEPEHTLHVIARALYDLCEHIAVEPAA